MEMLYSFSLADLSWLVYIDQKWNFGFWFWYKIIFVESVELRLGFGYGFYIWSRVQISCFKEV